jgi:hypothetical protein
VDIDRHTPTVVSYLQGAILIQGDIYSGSVASYRLIDTVIDYLLCHVVGAAGIGIHAGTFTYRLKTA